MKKLTPRFFFWLALGVFGLGLVVPQVAMAANPTVSDADIDAYCATVSGTKGSTQAEKDKKQACAFGYSGGYTGEAKAGSCAGLSTSLTAVCDSSYDAGKKKANSPGTVGATGADANESVATTCSKYHVAADKKACQKGYADEITKMAKSVGYNAGTGSQTDPCSSLGFGGAQAKKDCEDYYTKGQAQIPGGKCGDVDTYFSVFTKICSGDSEKAAGDKNPIVAVALGLVGWITALVGVGVVGGVIYGGFLYITARDNSGQAQKGVTIIVNSVVALIAWTFAFALINFIIPGGLFHA